MKTFTDNKDRQWTVDVNVASVKRVRAALDVDLLAVVERDGGLLNDLSEDAILLANVLYVLCKPQADAQGVSDEQFGEALAGDAIDRATEALLGDLIDFFRSGKRQTMRKVLAKMESLKARAMSLAEQKLDSGELEAELEQRLRRLMSGGSSSSSPASSGSTPTP